MRPRLRVGVTALVFGATLLLIGLLANGWARRSEAKLCAPWSQVTLAVQASPANARVLVDGRPLSAPLRACRGSRHQVHVSLDGHASWEWTGVLESDLTLSPELPPR